MLESSAGLMDGSQPNLPSRALPTELLNSLALCRAWPAKAPQPEAKSLTENEGHGCQRVSKGVGDGWGSSGVVSGIILAYISALVVVIPGDNQCLFFVFLVCVCVWPGIFSC